MNLADRLSALFAKRKWPIIGGIGTACALLLLASLSLLSGGQELEGFVPFTVQHKTLEIKVTERGSLESQAKTTLRCQVEEMSRGDRNGTRIIFCVPNGTSVKEGDLLVELDSATIRDRLDEQTVIVQKAVSAKTQAQSAYDNVLLMNETLKAAAELKYELSKLAIESYLDKVNGEFQLKIEDVARKIDEANDALVESRGKLDLIKVQRAGMEELFKLGYRGKSERDQTRLSYRDAESRLSSSINKIKTLQSNRRKLTLYDFKQQELTLRGDVDTSKRGVAQAVNDGIAETAKAMAMKEEANGTETKERERMEHFEEQLEYCKIFAPHDGMVVYARERRRPEISEGIGVYERQRLMELPNLTRMQVATQVHEAALDQVRPGLPVTVRVDAFPNRQYSGVVDKVAVIPEDGGYFSSGSAKTYRTNIKITEDVEDLKPGMTAVVDIHVDSLENVLSVPVQAVVQINRNTWCYVKTRGGIERKDVVPGRSNDQLVHIREGLAAGDTVILNPMDILEERERVGDPTEPEDTDVAKTAPKGGAPTSDKSATAAPAGKKRPGMKKRGKMPSRAQIEAWKNKSKRKGKSGKKSKSGKAPSKSKTGPSPNRAAAGA